MFRLTLESITAQSFDYTGYYTIVVTVFNETNDEIIKNILQDCWERRIINVNVLVPQNGQTTEATLYTYFPFTSSYCEKVTPVIWNQFESGHFVHQKREFFPRKTNNLYQCSLIVVAVEIPPHIFLRGFHSNKTIVVEGIDANLVYVLSEKMNFTPIFVAPDDIPRRGIIHTNGTASGALGMVINGTELIQLLVI